MQVLQCIAGAENLLAGQFIVPQSSRLQRTAIAKLEAIVCRPLYTAAALQTGRSPNDASRPPVNLPPPRMKMIS